MIDEVHQRLRQKLLVAESDEPPDITKYAGRGRLSGWVRVTAIRLALKLLREQKRDTPTSDKLMQAITPCDDDPELVYFKHLYRREFKAAFVEAMASLSSRERNLLRHQLIDGLSIDQIGALYQVHRSTAARWLARIRQGLALSIRRLMIEQLGIPKGEYESILRLIRSRMELSISGALDLTAG